MPRRTKGTEHLHDRAPVVVPGPDPAAPRLLVEARLRHSAAVSTWRWARARSIPPPRCARSGPKPWSAAYVQPSRRPTDGRYGENPNRLQHYYQYQVIMKPSPADAQDLLLASYREIGLDPLRHDFRFVEDDWESPTLGAWGLGWEVWCDGMEVGQFTYFQQVGGIPVDAAKLRDDLWPGTPGDVRAGQGECVRPRLQRRRQRAGREIWRRVPARRTRIQRV